jgi:hypothetical protein
MTCLNTFDLNFEPYTIFREKSIGLTPYNMIYKTTKLETHTIKDITYTILNNTEN